MRSGCALKTPLSNARNLPNYRTTMRSSGQRVVRAILVLALLANGIAASSSDSREPTRPSNLGEQPAQAYGLRRVLASSDRGQLATGDFQSDSNLLGQDEQPWSQAGHRRLAQATTGTPAVSEESPTPESTPVATSSPTSGATPTVTSAAPVATPVETPAPTAVPTASPTTVSTPASTPTTTRSPSSPSPSMTPAPTAAATAAPTTAATPAATPAPATPSPIAASPSPTILPVTSSLTPAASMDPAPAVTATASPSVTEAASPTVTPTPTPTSVATPVATLTPTSTPAATSGSLPVISLATPSPTPVAATATPSPTHVVTSSGIASTPTPTPRTTPASTQTPTPTPRRTTVSTPTPTPRRANATAPAPSTTNATAPTPSTTNAIAPAPVQGNATAPAPSQSNSTAPAPSPDRSSIPAPAPLDSTPGPAPSSTAPTPAPDQSIPTPAPGQNIAPTPTPGLDTIAPAPGSAPISPALVPAPGSDVAFAPTPIDMSLSHQSMPVAAPTSFTESVFPPSNLAPPGLALTPSGSALNPNGLAMTPNAPPPDLDSFSAVPGLAPASGSTGIPAPGPGPAFAPAPGPAFAPASGPGTPGFAPAFAPAPEPGTLGGAPASAPGTSGFAPAFAPGSATTGLAGIEGSSDFAPGAAPASAPGATALTPGAPGSAPESSQGLFPAGTGAPEFAPASGPSADSPALGPGASVFAPGLAPADSPSGSLVIAPAVAPAGTKVLQEGSMAFITSANSTATAIDPSTGMLVSASTLSATAASSTIYTNQETFTVRVQSATALTTSNLKASNGDIVSVSATPGAANSYDVAAKSRTSKGIMTLSTIAGTGVLANTITVNVDVTDAQVKITSPQLVTSDTTPTVKVDFGGRVTQLNPLLLYNITGVDRTDVVYDVNNGVVLVTAYVDENQATDILVSVDAGVTTSLAGNPNTAAYQVIKYRPPSTAVTSVSHTANVVIGATIAASLGSSLLAGTTAGISTLFLVNYMQTFYWQSRMAVPHFPENFRQFAEGFSWSGFDVIAPWKKSESNALDDSYSNVRATGFPNPPVGVTTSSFNTGSSTDSAYFTLPTGTAETESATTTASRRLTAYNADPNPASVALKRRSLLSVSPDIAVLATAPAPSGQLAPGMAPAPGPSLAPSAAPAGAPAPEAAALTGRRLLSLAGKSDDLHYHLLRHLLQDTNSTDDNSTTNGTLPGVLPGERLVVTSTGLSTTGTTNVTGATAVSRITEIEDDAMGTNITNPYKRLLRVLFWLAVVLAVVVVLHLAVLAAFLFSRWNTPSLLHFPRPELVVLLISLAAIAQGAASLFTGTGSQIAVGVILVIFLPVLFLLVCAWFIWRRLYHASIPQRRAAFILHEDPEIIQEHWVKHNRCTRLLGEFFIGPIRPEGTWQVLKSPDSRFLRKYGALFEDNRGPPMVMRNATYAVDPVTGWVNRGKLEPYYGRPLISLGRNRHLYRFQLQGFAKLIGVLRVIILALLLNGVSSSSSIAQVVALMVCSLIHFCFLRFVEPLCERGELAVALLAEVCDAGVFVCGLILILGQSASDRFRLTLGLIMLGLKGAGVVVAVLYNCYTSIAVAREFTRRYLWPYLPFLAKRPEDKFSDLVGKVILQDEHILARKYADKWMVRALGVGLFKRKLHRREVEDTRQLLMSTINPLARVSRPQKRPSLQQSPATNFIVTNPMSASPFAQSSQYPVVNAATWSVPSPDNSFSSSGPVASSDAAGPQANPGRWQGFANAFSRPSRSAQQRQQMASSGSGSVPLTGPMLPSIDEGSTGRRGGSNDLDASTAAAAANQQWLRSASRGSNPAPPSDIQPLGSGRYIPPSPWSTPEKPAAPSVSPSQASPYVGPFEAAARARAGQTPDQSPDQGSVAGSVTPQRNVARSASGRPGYAVPSPGWSTGIQGMGTTKAARPGSASSSSSGTRRSQH